MVRRFIRARPVQDIHLTFAQWIGSYRWVIWAAGFLVVLFTLFHGVQAAFFRDRIPVRLVIYASSVQEEALTQGIFPAFEESWEAETGRDLIIESIFGPSEVLARQINTGAPADIAVFSHAHPVTILRFGKLVDRDTQPVIIGCTPIVIITRPGNPKNISSFSDLSQPGLAIIHSNPNDSGVGQWALLAEYGSILRQQQDRQLAKQQTLEIWQNVRVLAPSARAAMTLFELGAADVLVTYEQDASLAKNRGIPLEIIFPEATVLAQPVAVLVDGNVSRTERDAAEAFLEFLGSSSGRQILTTYFLYKSEAACQSISGSSDTFTVENMGGWQQVHLDLVRNFWIPEIGPILDLENAPTLLEMENLR
jgi:sulfate transport system substrate-binding protein